MLADRKIPVLALCLSTLFPAVVSAGPGRGQALYENHCRECHESWAHERKARSVVSSREDLRRRVAAWATHAGLGWGPGEVDDVSDYLDRSFYHFGERQ